jgi:hypothetical protein
MYITLKNTAKVIFIKDRLGNVSHLKAEMDGQTYTADRVK